MMSEMQALNTNPQRLRQIMAKAGVDVDDPNLATRVQEYRAKQYKSWLQQLAAEKVKQFERNSLWAGGEAVDFVFSRWNPQLQPDAVQARAVGVHAYRLAKELAISGKGNIMLVGLPGTGKTSLAIAMAHYLEAEAGASILFLATNELKLLFQHDYFTDDRIRNKIDLVVTAAKQVDVLILDDFGTEAGSQNQIKGVRRDLYSTMKSIAEARFDGITNGPKGITIVTTNNTVDQLEQMYDPRTISRLLPETKDRFITFDGLSDVRGKGQ